MVRVRGRVRSDTRRKYFRFFNEKTYSSKLPVIVGGLNRA